MINNIPIKPLSDILKGKSYIVSLLDSSYEDGATPTEDQKALLSIAMMVNPKEVFEIGTFFGHTTLLLARHLPTSIIHTIDLPVDFKLSSDSALPKDDYHLIKRRHVGNQFTDRSESCVRNIRQYYGDTYNWDFLLAKNATFFFIDGSHTYEYCRNDSDKCYNICKTGTFIWHDCDEQHVGVVKLLCEWRQQGRDIVRIEGTRLAYLSNK